MKSRPPVREIERFSGARRHYHRTGHTKKYASWDEWVDGPGAAGRRKKSWKFFLFAFLSLLMAAAIAFAIWLQFN